MCTIKPMIKRILKVVDTVIGVVFFAAFVSVPFLHNIIDVELAQWMWYPSCAFLVAISVCVIHRSRKHSNEYKVADFIERIGVFPILLFWGSAFAINYYNTPYSWWWMAFVLVAVFFPDFILQWHCFVKANQGYNEEQTVASLKACWKYISFYWLVDLFYMATFNYWGASKETQYIWLALQFVFGILTMIQIFCNLAKVFLSNAQKNYRGLLQDFILGITITVYLIYLIPNTSLQGIVLTIVAAVYGGLLTLVGVAWTIKDSNIKRADDLLRVERERKEEERKKHIPYVRITSNKDMPTLIVNACMTGSLNFDNPVELAELTSKTFYVIDIKDFIVKNISNANIILDGVYAYGKYHQFSKNEIVEPGAYCTVKTTGNTYIYAAKIEESIYLIMSDVIGNRYKVACHLCFQADIHSYRTIFTVAEQEYTGFGYCQAVTSVEVPSLMEE